MNVKERHDVSITLSAAAGLGVQTAEDLARRILSAAGFFVFSSREYMSRVRGGNNSTQFRISTSPVRALTDDIDWLFALSPGLRSNITESLSAKTRILGDAAVIGEEISRLGYEMTDLRLAERAKGLGGPFYSSVIVAGVIAGLFALPEEAADALIESRFTGDAAVAENNKKAFRDGVRLGVGLCGGEALLPSVKTLKKDELFMDGDTSLALGAAAAGFNYITAYPMSPSTGLFMFYARHAPELEAVVEQAEDEICAINMAVGAACAGSRAIITTSDGGFALMGEGLSLAGVAEAPVVMHLAQRPGPATGLATRTEQAGLELALYSGHGEFPRALYSPVNTESCFKCAGLALQTARKFQTPAIILTDQYLLDTGYDVVRPDPDGVPAPVKPEPAGSGYKRYAFPENGEVTSPFGVPGYGEGFVSLDSHEHTEEGRIDEDRALRRRMNDKRLAKLPAMQREALPPIVEGKRDARVLLVCWGSVFEPLREAVQLTGREDLAIVACEQVYPLSDQFVELMKGGAVKIFVEGNATGQFARVVRSLTGIKADAQIHRYDGFQFSAGSLSAEIIKTLAALGVQG